MHVLWRTELKQTLKYSLMRLNTARDPTKSISASPGPGESGAQQGESSQRTTRSGNTRPRGETVTPRKWSVFHLAISKELDTDNGIRKDSWMTVAARKRAMKDFDAKYEGESIMAINFSRFRHTTLGHKAN